MVKRSLPQPLVRAARAAALLLDRDRPWRRDFLALRAAEKLVNRGAPRRIASKARDRFERKLPKHPDAVLPYLDRLEQQRGIDATSLYAREISERSEATAGLLVEVAKFHYLRNLLALGDALIERAKSLDPTLPRIYDEEAWSQRARGNLHREIQAVERSLALAKDQESRVYWTGWLASAFARQGHYDEAWAQLRSLPPLEAGNEILLTKALCARQLGMPDEVDAAYRSFAPTGDSDFDLPLVATLQFTKYERAAETAALIDTLGDHVESTQLLELGALARLQLGQIDTAIQHLRAASKRPDRASTTLGTLGQLLELTDNSDAALQVYLEAEERDLNSITRFRLGSLLAERGDLQQAVTRSLRRLDPAPLSSRAFEDEVDPAIPDLLVATTTVEKTDLVATLRQLTQRASSQELLTSSSQQLAHQLAARGEWAGAWQNICRSQGDRLPSVPLTLPEFSSLGPAIEMYFNEVTETEPIDQSTVLYESSLGASTSCNPLAICRELLRTTGDSMLHVWSINERAVIHPSLRDLPNVVFVRKGSPGHYHAMATASFLVNSSTFEYGFVKREGQRYLNTWHGVPWKTMGRDNLSEPFAYGNISRNFLQADVVLCPDPHTLDVLSRGHDVEQLAAGTFVLGGYPRNDLAVNLEPARRLRIRERLGVSERAKLVLYMPTWQGTFHARDAAVAKVVETAVGLASPGVTIAVRAHHYVSAAFAAANPSDGVTLVPAELDTNELIGAADVVVTDFSSVLFDAAAVGVPVVKILTDLAEYEAERGLYFTPEEVPGANAYTVAEAQSLVLQAVQDRVGFMADYAAQTTRFSLGEQGDSAARAVELLFDDSPTVTEPPADEPVSEPPVLIVTGGLLPNGITRSTRSLLTALHGSGYSAYLIPANNAIDSATPDTLADIRNYAHVLPRVGGTANTQMESEALGFFSSQRYVDSPFLRQFIDSGSKREARRLFGEAAFFAAVEFGSYFARSTALVNYGVRVEGGARGVVFHNEIWQEIESRYPKLRGSLYTTEHLDFYASVSDGVREYNSRTMNEHVGLPTDKHITIENTINVAEIQTQALEPLAPEDREWYDTDDAHVCVVARFSPEKNHSELFTALAECRDSLSRPVKITCLGDGPLRQKLEEQVVEAGLTDLVRLRGLVHDVPAHVKAADALFLPSLYEGQPLVLLEALTVGTPVVATDSPGSRSVLHDGAFGQLVPISRAGIVEGLHLIADGKLVDASAFDPDKFTQHSLGMFIDAISSPQN